MPTALLEIVDLGNGEIVLQHAEEDSEPLVRIRFSEESQVYLSDNSLEVAKAMIQAGIQAAATIEEEESGLDQLSPDAAPRVFH